MNTIETQKQVQQWADTKAQPDLRVITMKEGKLCHTDLQGTERTGNAVHQGDVYLLLLDKLPDNLTKVTDRQLAPGTTKGSRHVAEGDVEIFVARHRSPLTGPVVRAKDTWFLRHPEHADHQLPAGDYQVIYQQDHAQDEIAAVRD